MNLTRTFFSVLWLLSAVSTFGQNKTYYISTQGNDSTDGLSASTAWKSIDKVNSIVFQPGDKILFKGGETWHGQLFPKGSGVESNPITLTSYGEGRPVIDFDDAEGAGIRLTDQSHWRIHNMEVTSGSQPKVGIGRQGIVAISAKQDCADLKITNCYMHDIWGQLGGNTDYCGYNSAGILVKSLTHWGHPDMKRTRWKDVEVGNNTIQRMDKCGIIVLSCKTGMRVHHNYIEDTGGDGIFCGGCDYAFIEYNVAKRTCLRSGYPYIQGDDNWWPHTAAIWIQDAEGTIMQYNAVYDTHRQPGNGDGEAYDFDFNCIRCIAQYNYSENNGGFLLIMNRTFENIARYNISVNDQTHLVQMQCANTERNLIYNNVFYIDYGTVDLDFFCGNDNEKEKESLGAWFFNNIFYATGQSYFRTVYTSGEVIGRNFDETTQVPKGEMGKLFYHNCYFGPWKNGIPNDPEAIITDPMLVAPGTVSNGKLDNSPLKAYQLQSGSPMINAGIKPCNLGNRDFFGYMLKDGIPDIGVFEASNSGATADLKQIKAAETKYNDESNWALAKFIFPESLRIKEGDKNLTIATLIPLAKEFTGTITWQPAKGKSTKIDIAKEKSRQQFTLKVKGTKSDILNSKINVSLSKDGKTQTFSIPFAKEDK